MAMRGEGSRTALPSNPPQHGLLPEYLRGLASPTRAARADLQPWARSHPSDPLGRRDGPGGNARVRGRQTRSWTRQEGRPCGCAQPVAGTYGQGGTPASHRPLACLSPVRAWKSPPLPRMWACSWAQAWGPHSRQQVCSPGPSSPGLTTVPGGAPQGLGCGRRPQAGSRKL